MNLERTPPQRTVGWNGEIHARAGLFDGDVFARAVLRGALQVQSEDHSRAAVLRASAGLAAPAAAQHLFLLGGAGTLPGYRYRSLGGERFALIEAELSHDVWRPWIRLRLVGAAGNTGGIDFTEAPAAAAWRLQQTRGFHASAGAGVALFWDVLRIDRYRGLNGGRWVWQISASPEFADIS